MKKRKTVCLILDLLLVLVTVLTVIHLSTRDTVPEGALLVRQNGEERYVVPEKTFQYSVNGSIVNGKGEERRIDARGIALKELAEGDYSLVSVLASDEYSAQIMAEEIENAFLILDEKGNVQLVVFGDTNSKRAVKNVAKVEFR